MFNDKEMGGYLPLELNKGNDYYASIEGCIRLNSARSAILLAIREGGYNTVYIPTYLCSSVSNSLKKNNVNYKFYNINHKFLPELTFSHEQLKAENACILLVNYYGIISDEAIREAVEKYRNVIIDNTQAFFNEPIMSVYNIYSCRKFFGVPDGSYLIYGHLEKYHLKEDFSWKRATHLMSSIDNGTQFGYEDSLINEKAIEGSGILMMSKLTQSILGSVDYELCKEKRKRNFSILHDLLNGINELIFDIDLNKQIPMVYPLLIQKEGIRDFLINHKVYVPQWWKACIKELNCNEFEKKLSKYLLPLPIDQRYNDDDMKYLADLVYGGIN